MPIFISHSNPLNCPVYIFAINDPNEHWTSWNYSKSYVRLSDSCDRMISILGHCTGCCDSTSADGILYLITTVCFTNWNGYWHLATNIINFL